jgi:hypothetical protein
MVIARSDFALFFCLFEVRKMKKEKKMNKNEKNKGKENALTEKILCLLK